MDMDFVSEVDRKFFANNMLSNEDWVASSDLSDLMCLDPSLPDLDLMSALPSDLQQLPGELEDQQPFSTVTHDDLLNDWSDSSDSGVSGLIGGMSPDPVVKVEPLSPSPSLSSDSGDGVFFHNGVDGHIEVVLQDTESKTEEPGLSSHLQRVVSPTSPHSQRLLSSSSLQSQRVVSPTSPQSQTVLSPTSPQITVIKQETAHSLLLNGSSPSIPGVKIKSILNSKVKIQPKVEPLSPQKPMSPASQQQQQQALVLTPEEFQRLTDQGVLRFQPPKQESVLKPQVTLPSTAPTSLSHPISSSPSPPPLAPAYLFNDKDDKVVKRQQRMIKNRESASLSRKRKKEYMSSLEQRLAEFGAENERLRQENEALKQRLGELHTVNENLKQTVPSILPPAAKRTCLLTIILLLSLNLGSWSGITFIGRTDLKETLKQPLIHKGRQLMSINEAKGEKLSLDETVDKLHNMILEYGGTGYEQNNTGEQHNPMCPTYFNKTESIRLAEQLAGWMYRHEEEKIKVNKNQQKRLKNKQIRPISTLRRAMRGDVHGLDKKYIRSMDASYPIQLFGGADSGKDFLKSIHRRNDTFYVLSFNEDYYLVPAVYHNKTSRPRMSLVMPAIALNDTMMPPAGHVGMMQIDCEVVNTQLIHVQEKAIPRNAREKFNATYTDARSSDYYR